MANPFVFSPSSSSGSGTSNPFSFSPPKPKGLTGNQMLQLYLASQHKQHSFLHTITHGGGHALSWGLQQILRPATAVAEGTRAGLEGKGVDLGDALHGAKQGFLLRKHTTFSDVLKQEFPQWSKEHTVQRAVAGFGLDVVTDPTLPLQIGADILTGGALTPELIAARLGAESIRAASEHGATIAARKAAAEKAVQLFAEAGPNWKPAKLLADTLANASMDTLDERAAETVPFLEHMLNSEMEQQLGKGLTLKYRIPFTSKELSTPTHIAGMRIAPKAPSLERIAAGAGIIGKAPLAAHVAEGIGRAFKHSWGEPVWAKSVLLQEHMAERKTDQYVEHLVRTYGQVTKQYGLNAEDMYKAWIWGENHPSYLHINPDGSRQVIEDRIQQAVDKDNLTEGQGEFLKAHTTHTEFLRKQDVKYGVKYQKQLMEQYIPHLYERNGAAITVEKSNKLPGYVREREGKLTAQEMYDIYKRQVDGTASKAEKIIQADPVKLMAIRTERGARAHTRELMLDVMTKAQGVPMRIPNVAAIAKHADRWNKAEAVLEQHSWIYHPQKVKAWQAKGRKEVTAKYNKMRDRISREYRAKRYPITHGDPTKIAKEKERFDALAKRIKREVKDPKVYRQRLDKALAEHKAALDKLQGEEILGRISPERHTELVQQEIRALQRVDHLEANAQAAKAIEQEQHLAHLQTLTEHAAKRAERAANVLDKGPTKINPAFDRHTMTKFNRKIGDQWWGFPDHLAEPMNRVKLALQSHDEVMAKMGETAMKAMSAWKSIVTTINPGYHVRNTLSDVWNMYVAGVPMWAIVKYAQRAARYYTRAEDIHRMVAAVGGDYSKLEGLLSKSDLAAITHFVEAYNRGIFAGFVQGDIQAVRHVVAHGRGARSLLNQGRLLKAYSQAWTDINRNRENIGRFTHYLYRREAQHLGPKEAADWVKKAHFDYTELSDFERNHLKKWIPFYTWTRKNIPYQLNRLVSAPGRYATFPKLGNLGAELALGDHNAEVPSPGTMPGFLATQLALSAPGGKGLSMLLPQFGPSDLTKVPGLTGGLGDAFKQDVSLVAPWIKLPVELATNRNSFTGQEIDSGRATPVGGPGGAVLSALGLTEQTKRGNITEQGLNPWVAYIMRDLGGPVANVSTFSAAPSAQASRGNHLDLLSYFGGLSVYNRNLDKEQTIAQLNFQDEVKKAIRRARDTGALPEPKKQKQSPFQKQLMAQLSGGG